MIIIRQEVPLLSYNTFSLDAIASVFVESDNVCELVDYVRNIGRDPALILGGGSNILFVSKRCEIVIHPVIKGIELIDETDENVLIRVGAGEVWDDFVSWCVNRNYAGVENLSHIPGTVGACPIQNIGAYGVEAKETIITVEAIEMETGETVTFNKKQCLFDYRDSFFKKNKGKYLITNVYFQLSKHFEPNIKYNDIRLELNLNSLPCGEGLEGVNIATMRQAIINIRSRKLPNPTEVGNAGSFFKNPTINSNKAQKIIELYPQASLYPVSQECWKISAAWLIEQCEWKGKRNGAVGVHSSQPLVIVNYGGATGNEILDFARKISDSVFDIFDIKLESEVNIV